MNPAIRWVAATLLLVGVACAHPGPRVSPTQEPKARSAKTLPTEVQDFIERREGCDHFRGEEPYDEARAAFIAQELARLCEGTDAELARLKRRNADSPEVLEVLHRFEEQVE
ncbi:MAG TPA: hypothetical protein VK013_18965 [Myxococcaceae bacterium]|nr:hypothetical protein [Myxococcaceae bacterium]